MAELPQYLQLQKRFPNDVALITLNVDFDEESGSPSDDLVEKITLTLKDALSVCDNYISSSPMETVLSEFEAFGLPVALLYDSNGRLVHTFDGHVDVAGELTNRIDKLLAAKNSSTP